MLLDSLKVPQQGTFNEYHNMFSCRNRKISKLFAIVLVEKQNKTKKNLLHLELCTENLISWPTHLFLDDEPDDGANHYIIVYGFHSPHIFGLLAELGINVSSIIRINSQDYSRFIPPKTDEQPIEKDEKTLGMYSLSLVRAVLLISCLTTTYL